MPANFGGTSYTDIFFNWSRKALSRIATKFGVDAVNCSDGAFIEGIRPCRAADLTLGGHDLDRCRIKARIAGTLRSCQPGQLISPERLKHFGSDARVLFDRLLDEVNGAILGDGQLELTWLRLTEIVAATEATNLAVPMIRGSLDTFRKTSMYAVSRLPADDRRSGLEQALLTTLREILEHCREQIVALEFIS